MLDFDSPRPLASIDFNGWSSFRHRKSTGFDRDYIKEKSSFATTSTIREVCSEEVKVLSVA